MSPISPAEKTKKRILVEVANEIMLDLDWGTYLVATGLGLSPFNVK